MAIARRLRLVTLIGALIGASCAGPGEPGPAKGPEAVPPEAGREFPYGADSGEAGDVLAGPGRGSPVYGPTPVQVYPVVLVLGPGAARGYAHAGVFRALHEAKVPVGAVLGTGMGALVGAVFATSKTINEFEWKLLRFDEEVFLGGGFSLTSIFRRSKSASALEDTLQKTFDGMNVRDAEIPLRVGIHAESQGGFVLEDRGRLTSLLRIALAEPELYESGSWLGAPARSASATKPFPVEEAKRLSIGPVVVVDLLDDEIPYEVANNEDKEIRSRLARARRNAGGQLAKADLVLRPDLAGVGYFDYGEKTAAIFKGKAETRKHLDEIRQLVGLPNTDTP